MLDWLTATLKHNTEIALFLSLTIGYTVGSLTFRGIGLGVVTSTLLAALAIGQIGIEISGDVKTIFFLFFLFAIGFSVGPQFVRGLASNGLPQALYALVVAALCLGSAWFAARMAGYDPGLAAGLYAGAATITPAMGLAETAVRSLGLPAAAEASNLQSIPIAYAITYIYGTFGAAVVLSLLGPRLLRIDLAAACRDYEQRMGGSSDADSVGSAWHQYIIRAYRIEPGAALVGKTVAEAEIELHRGRIFIERLRRGDTISDAGADTVLETGDVVAISGPRSVLTEGLTPYVHEVDDAPLLDMPVEGVDIVLTGRALANRTLADIASDPSTRGIFLRRVRRGATGVLLPILPDTLLHRGDVITVQGRPATVTRLARRIGRVDRPGNQTDIAFLALVLTAGALIGTPILMVGEVPLTLSTAGGTLLAGLAAGWLRFYYPAFRGVPPATIWFMNSIGINVFIAVMGLDAGPMFVEGLREAGFSLLLWGAAVTTVPLILALYIGKYVFRFDDAVVISCCAGARGATAALEMLTRQAKSDVPALGFTVPYAVGNTALTILGVAIVLLIA
ncbi:aspartate-alanine antiporter [Acuticoccus sp. M5D2P5]|uniref:aspartate-alanine antiporter n=1 Tax=Acuticoccus kalidii TaxID=2910977 RepID=UPI001F1D13C8|nr:aspartate-alanine antiporter [Acuticoccus kalidii]MCF3932031.1 aspartate-alanine antiporter [Acuticoccus kalidii]